MNKLHKMALYTKNQAIIYTKKFTQTQKKNCKSVILELLVANNIKRSKEAIGQWFANPNKVKGFDKLSKETILMFMYQTFNENDNATNVINAVAKYLNF